jgi:hypothetical protein
MEWNLPVTVGVLVGLVALGAVALVVAPIPMGTSTILMMVVPSMLVFGAIALFVGVKHGEWRAGSTR